jgi:glutathione synthase/RimK-type ligase-like ATP-grasp enzyme
MQLRTSCRMTVGGQMYDDIIMAEEAPRPAFSSQITQVTKELNIDLEWCSANWVARLRKGTKVAHIVGYTFPLNNSASAQLAHDKVATYAILDANGISAIPHYLLRLGSRTVSGIDEIPSQPPIPIPLVFKPNDGSHGTDVYLVRCPDDYLRIFSTMAARYRAIAISPWIPIEDEFRVVVLDGTSRIIYRKVRHLSGFDKNPNEWRHNLRYGAIPALVTDNQLSQKLNWLALAGMSSLGLRFASVDIVTSSQGASILEINGAVTLERFSSQSMIYSDLALSVYKDAMRAVFE